MVLKEGGKVVSQNVSRELCSSFFFFFFYKTFVLSLGPHKWLNVHMERSIALQFHLMIGRGRKQNYVSIMVARIIKSPFQVGRLDLNVCSSASSMYKYRKVNNQTGTTEVETEHFGADLPAPPAEVTTFELLRSVNSIICQFSDRWISSLHCGSQRPSPVWKWQASCQNHHPAPDGSSRPGQQGGSCWQIHTAEQDFFLKGFLFFNL